MRRVAIIGGGVAGLASAALLARSGYQVDLFERGEEVGGRVGEEVIDGFTFDTGPSWYLMPEVFDHYFRLLGTSSEKELDLVRLDPAYRVFSEPGSGYSPVTIPLREERIFEVFESLEPGSSERLREYLASGRDALQMAEKYFLYNTFTRLRSILTPEVLLTLPRLFPLLTQSLHRHVSDRFDSDVIRKILGYPAVFLGTHPRAAPAMYHLMSALDLSDGVQYPRGGFRTLIDSLTSLAIRNGATITTKADITAIHTRPTRRRVLGTGKRARKKRVVGLAWTNTSTREDHFTAADVVVSAADLHHTENQLLSAEDRSYSRKWWRRRQSGPGAVLTLLGVRDEIPELPHHSLFFTRDWDSNFRDIFGRTPRVPEPASLYVSKPSATDGGLAPESDDTLFILTPIPADENFGHGGRDGTGAPEVEAVADASIAQISEWAGIPDLSQRIIVRHTIGPSDFAARYSSWRGGILGPGHTLAQSAMFRAKNTSRVVDGLFYAGGTVSPGIGLPMCLISAQNVLKAVRGDHSAGPMSPEDVQPRGQGERK